jgi:hypothetical protein
MNYYYVNSENNRSYLTDRIISLKGSLDRKCYLKEKEIKILPYRVLSNDPVANRLNAFGQIKFGCMASNRVGR